MSSRRRVGERGQVTIPKDLRKRMGLLPGNDVYFSIRGGEIVIEPEKDSFVEWSRRISGKVGSLEKTIDRYREEEMEKRLPR